MGKNIDFDDNNNPSKYFTVLLLLLLLLLLLGVLIDLELTHVIDSEFNARNFIPDCPTCKRMDQSI